MGLSCGPSSDASRQVTCDSTAPWACLVHPTFRPRCVEAHGGWEHSHCQDHCPRLTRAERVRLCQPCSLYRSASHQPSSHIHTGTFQPGDLAKPWSYSLNFSRVLLAGSGPREFVEMCHRFCHLQNPPGQVSNFREARKAGKKFCQSLVVVKRGGPIWLSPINTRLAGFLLCPPGLQLGRMPDVGSLALDPCCLGWNLAHPCLAAQDKKLRLSTSVFSSVKWGWSGAHLIGGLLGQSLSCVRLFVTPWTVVGQAPLSMGLSWQQCWSGLPFTPPGDLPDSGIEPASPEAPALTGRFFTTEPPGKPSPHGMTEQMC